MKIVRFETMHAITRFGSRGASIAGVPRSRGDVRVSLVDLLPDGVIGMHEAASAQLLLIVEGSGRVRGANEDVADIGAGDGAHRETGERHETTTERGLRAVVAEAESLELL